MSAFKVGSTPALNPRLDNLVFNTWIFAGKEILSILDPSEVIK